MAPSQQRTRLLQNYNQYIHLPFSLATTALAALTLTSFASASLAFRITIGSLSFQNTPRNDILATEISFSGSVIT